MAHETEQIHIMIVKNGNHGPSMAKTLNLDSPETGLIFSGTNNPQEAARSYENGAVHLIVAGLLHIDWRSLLDVVGPNNLIVMSSLDRPEDREPVENAGVTFVAINPTEDFAENLYQEIRKKLATR